jgi:hypothetical protein
MVLQVALKYSAERMLKSINEKMLVNFLANSANSDRVPVRMSSIRAIGFIIEHQLKNEIKVENELASILAKV